MIYGRFFKEFHYSIFCSRFRLSYFMQLIYFPRVRRLLTFATLNEPREKAVAAADMSVVSRQLEETSRGTLRGTLNGRIPRMLLIQARKREEQSLAGAITTLESSMLSVCLAY